MFTNYKILDNNGEKILILYIDYNYEFGIDFNIKHKYSNMKKKINSFIKNNKIKFDGEKIALSIGGIVLAVLLIVENPSNYKSSELDFVYLNDSILPQNNYSYVIKKDELSTEIVDNTIKEDNKIVNNDKKVEVKQEIKEEKKDTNNKVAEKVEVKQEIKEEKKDTNNKVVEKVEVVEVKNDNNVTIYRSNGDVINISMNDYLIGVVGAEMPASFDIEALKAQAVIARTYALKKIENNIKLTDSVSTQSYLSNEELKAKWGSQFDTYYNKIKNAVLETDGIAIFYDDKYIDAVYHSTSNGITEDSKNVWGNSIPYLKSVDSSWDKEQNSYLRTITKNLSDVLDILGVTSDNYEILEKDESNRVSKIVFGEKTFSGVEFRNLLGLRSADFDIEIVDDTINITTRGYGHGVGLSQYGANYLAKNGYNYEKIVKYYYNGVKLKKIV